MPWELTIINAQDRQQPLGEQADVVARLAAALPGAVLQPAPGPSPEMIAQMPPVLRERFLQPRPLTATFDGPAVTIEFFAENQPAIQHLGAEVRGEGNPIPALAILCQANGWAAINNTDDALVDLTAKDSPEWEQFCLWRDEAVALLKADGNADQG